MEEKVSPDACTFSSLFDIQLCRRRSKESLVNFTPYGPKTGIIGYLRGCRDPFDNRGGDGAAANPNRTHSSPWQD
jgi:hypothetical protein